MGPDRVARLDRHQPAFTGHKPACGPLLVIFPFLSAAPPISLALEKKPCPFSSIASPRILPPPKSASGPATYFGEYYDKPTIGDAARAIEPKDILRANRMMRVASVLGLIAATGIRLMIGV